MQAPTKWDPELYEARHSFVWQFGQDLLELLDPRPGERILDLGCGPGNLTQKIAERGADVVGLDSSPAMIGQARQNYPRLQFTLLDAAAMCFHREFDAVFSNAALHWMLDAATVAGGISRALRNGGRFVAELGGKGNVHHIEAAIEAVLEGRLGQKLPPKRTFFPSAGEYSILLESAGMEIRTVQVFERPTKLEGDRGMENWLRQFAWYYFDVLPEARREAALQEVVEKLRPVLCGSDGWFADYKRLRLVAAKI